ncbi:MAG: DNA polymerase III subunit alpha [Fimbriimonadales bacterium]|nr:DNA polymerase III subunit alpha [Fimbriimonadales bacterium]
MCTDFVHLHNHTQYSLLDGATRVKDMVRRAKELGMPAIAISDHGAMLGVMEFYYACKAEGIKPILGVEAYVAPNGLGNRAKGEEKDSFHLLLLAKNLQGYRNLCKLTSIAALEGFYRRPRIDHELLRRHAEGLIGTSACLGSEICQELVRGRYDRAQYLAGMYDEIFGHGNFFIELQDHGLHEQRQIREPLLRIAKELDLPLIATNDAHYLCRGDTELHDVLLCIQTGHQVSDEDRFRFESDQFYVKTQEEMARLFSDVPEALSNTAHVAAMCDVSLESGRPEPPDPELPEGETNRSYLRKLAWKGLEERMGKVDDRARERLEHELSVIERTGFESYFLLVREFTQFARRSGIAMGVRGSAAASLVSYCLGITDLDPLEYDLTFERFLNPERVSMPDIDLDFEDARRHEMIEWVTERYGKDRVAQIITYQTMGAKAAIKDCGRVRGWAPQETDRITKTIPNRPHITLREALEESPDFRQMYDGDPRVKALVDEAMRLEGTIRGVGTHAAGVVITKSPLVEHIPLYRTREGQPVTGFEMGILEKMQMLKMDFLGLKNLTVLSKCIQNLRLSRGLEIDLQRIPLDDDKTYELLGNGDTTGVFQLESAGMRRYITQLKPRSVRELAAMVALFRPGPMDHIPTYINNKWGRSKPEYLDPRMEPILAETYGVIVYQDQVLKLVQALAGFTLGKSDILRRAMGKKKREDLESMQAEFLEGTAKNGIAPETAQQIWSYLEPFSGYAFNKAHAVCYAMIAYQTAYLKANYPVEYLAALMATYADNEDKVVSFIEEARRRGIQVLSPDVNESLLDFTTVGGKIRFGLAAIKNVGTGFMESVLQEREARGPFQHLFDFCRRTKQLGLNRMALEALAKAGAFDSLHPNRAAVLASLEAALADAETHHRNSVIGQGSLFGESSGHSEPLPELPSPEPLPRTSQLALEKEVLGIYVSDHPLRGLERVLQSRADTPCSALGELEDGAQVRMAGIITRVEQRTLRSGDKLLTFMLEDFSGQTRWSVPDFRQPMVRDMVVRDAVVVATGRVRVFTVNGEERRECRLEQLDSLEDAVDRLASEFNPNRLVVSLGRATEGQLLALREAIDRHPGLHEVVLQFVPEDRNLPLATGLTVNPDGGFLAEARRILPQACFEVEYGDDPTAVPEEVA